MCMLILSPLSLIILKYNIDSRIIYTISVLNVGETYTFGKCNNVADYSVIPWKWKVCRLRHTRYYVLTVDLLTVGLQRTRVFFLCHCLIMPCDFAVS